MSITAASESVWAFYLAPQTQEPDKQIPYQGIESRRNSQVSDETGTPERSSTSHYGRWSLTDTSRLFPHRYTVRLSVSHYERMKEEQPGWLLSQPIQVADTSYSEWLRGLVDRVFC